MTLLHEVKNYIEEHISSLESDAWFDFVINAYEDLKSEEFNQLLEVLKSIEPKFEDKVEPSLMYVITRAIEEYEQDWGANSMITVKQFLNRYMRSFFTFDIQYLERYIIANEKEWDNVKEATSIFGDPYWRVEKDG